MQQHILVFDIETVIDADSSRQFLRKPELTDSEARIALQAFYLEKTNGKNNFARQPFHQVVAISYAQLNREGQSMVFNRVGSGGDVGSSEKELLQGFFQFIEQHKPQLVSYHGRGFDIPVLKYRAMKHQLSCPTWFQYRYDYRYDQKQHLDLLEFFSDFGASARCSLDEIASCFSVPGKLDISGEQVLDLFENNQIETIRHYCECDVLSTLLLFLRWQLFNGQLSHDHFYQSNQSIHNYLQQEVAQRPYLQAFLDAWHGEQS
ncbi:MAG: 3'-5' exonuclease [Mariprofundaceae bacterium]|nr:3'-5' exonuclease [Mariprofundaceae bacterium]